MTSDDEYVCVSRTRGGGAQAQTLRKSTDITRLRPEWQRLKSAPGGQGGVRDLRQISVKIIWNCSPVCQGNCHSDGR